jgi:TonB family protein
MIWHILPLLALPTPAPSPRPIGVRASPLAAYITAMHRRIHPIFTNEFLGGLDARHELSEPGLSTTLEIVVRGDGTLEQVTIVRASGATKLDAGALDAVMRAAPFVKPPLAALGADGKVRLDWAFARDPVRGCGTFGVDSK